MQITRSDDIAQLVRQRRRDLGIAQADLANRTGITRQLLSRFEQGKSDLPLGVTLLLLRELTLSVDVRSREDRRSTIELRLPPPLQGAVPRIDSTVLRAAQEAVASALAARSPAPRTEPDRGDAG